MTTHVYRYGQTQLMSLTAIVLDCKENVALGSLDRFYMSDLIFIVLLWAAFVRHRVGLC